MLMYIIRTDVCVWLLSYEILHNHLIVCQNSHERCKERHVLIRAGTSFALQVHVCTIPEQERCHCNGVVHWMKHVLR